MYHDPGEGVHDPMSEVDDLCEQLLLAKETMAAWKARSVVLEEWLKETRARRTQLERRLDSLELQNEKLLDQALKGYRESQSLAETLMDKERHIVEMSRELQQTRAHSEDLAAKAEAEAATARELKERVELLHRSTSWRLTAPLRALMQTLLGLKATVTKALRVGAATSQTPEERRSEPISPEAAPFPPAVPATESSASPSTDLCSRNRILIVGYLVPMPDRSSGSTRLWEMVKAICALGKSVTFGSSGLPSDYRPVLNNVEEELRSYVQALEGFGVTTIFGYAEIVEHLKHHGPDYQLVILSFPDIMYRYLPAVRAYAPQAHVIYDTVDLHGLRLEREAQLKGSEEIQQRAHHYKKMENVNLRSADTVVAITEKERETILKLVPDADVVVIPNIHVVSDEPQVPLAERAGLLFIGHYLHSPNADAVEYFIREILPLVERPVPKVKFFMLGSSMTDDVLRLASDSVEAIGYIPDPTPYFGQCRVFVAPLRFGAGMKGKIGQSMSLGLPVVTTSIGAEGMGLRHGVNVLIGDNPSEFADAVVQLYLDDELWRAVAREAQDYIQRNFSPGAVQKQIEILLESAHHRRSTAP
jgi:glycosyltransferase involved in cell wall biosynthesis